MLDWLRFRLLLLIFPSRATGVCANRWWRNATIGSYRLRLTITDTRAPDGYCREEMVEMLRTVRKHEKIMGWTVPDGG